MKILLKLIFIVIASMIIPCSAYAEVQQIEVSPSNINVLKDAANIPIGMHVSAGTPVVSLPSGVSEAILKTGPAFSTTNGYPTWNFDGPYLFTYGYRDAMGDHWAKTGVTLKVKSGDRIISTVWTTTPPIRENKVGQDHVIAYLYTVDGKTQLGTVTEKISSWSVTLASCELETSDNIVVHFPDVTPSEVMNGSVTEMQTLITYRCIAPTSVMVSITPGVGLSSDDDIINTNLPGLGIKLGWDATPGIPLKFGAGYPFNIPVGEKEFHLSAKPVHSGSEPIGGGIFTASATMSFSYN